MFFLPETRIRPISSKVRKSCSIPATKWRASCLSLIVSDVAHALVRAASRLVSMLGSVNKYVTELMKLCTKLAKELSADLVLLISSC